MKMRRIEILSWAGILAALFATGCFKTIRYETFYVLRPWMQEGTTRKPIPTQKILTYAFDADTVQWDVLSYEDAVAGIITSRVTGEKRQPIAQGEPYVIDGNENWQAMRLDGPRFFILVVDQLNSLYGFTQQPIGENLPEMYVSVTFFPRDKGKRYVKGKWIMCNDFYEEPQPKPDPTPETPGTPDDPDDTDDPDAPDKPGDSGKPAAFRLYSSATYKTAGPARKRRAELAQAMPETKTDGRNSTFSISEGKDCLQIMPNGENDN